MITIILSSKNNKSEWKQWKLSVLDYITKYILWFIYNDIVSIYFINTYSYMVCKVG